VEDPVVPHLAQTTFDTTNPRVSAEFWRQLLDLVYREGHEPPEAGTDDAAGRDWLNLLTRDGASCLAFQGVEELSRSTWPVATIPQQLHLDLTVGTLDELMAARDRIMELGGELLFDRSASSEEPLQVFADLDGHPFCVFVVHQV
jgi:Glyoxalase-like domain